MPELEKKINSSYNFSIKLSNCILLQTLKQTNQKKEKYHLRKLAALRFSFKISFHIFLSK